MRKVKRVAGRSTLTRLTAEPEPPALPGFRRGAVRPFTPRYRRVWYQGGFRRCPRAEAWRGRRLPGSPAERPQREFGESLARTVEEAIAHALLHGGETQVWGDAGYRGGGKREENRGAAERRKASVRAKGGASVPVCESTISAMRSCATGGWRRTGSASPCCSGWPTCSSPGAMLPAEAGPVCPPPPQGGTGHLAQSSSGAHPLFRHEKTWLRLSNSCRPFPHEPNTPRASQNLVCSDLP